MKKYILFFITTLLLISCIPPQTCDEKSNKSIQLNPEITVNEISEHIQYLASDELGGRFPGTPESKLAQEYIINQYKNSGILPFEGNGYLQNFKFISDIVTGEKAICPIKRPSNSATRDTARALVARSASMINCSV